MTISAVGGVDPTQQYTPLAGAESPEAGEVPGAPDHDGDADDGGKAAGTVSMPGRVDLHA